MLADIMVAGENIVQTGKALEHVARQAAGTAVDGFRGNNSGFDAAWVQATIKYTGGNTEGEAPQNTRQVTTGSMHVNYGIDMSQGGLVPGGPLNAAIQGQDFFVLRNTEAAGSSNQEFYTRASNFHFKKDGSIVDSHGRSLMGFEMVNGQVDMTRLTTIKVDPTIHDLNDIGFEADGILTTNYAARKNAIENGDAILPEGEKLFQIALAKVPQPEHMDHAAGTSFTTNLESGRTTGYVVSSADGSSVSGGQSESSNINPAEITVIGVTMQRKLQAEQAGFTLLIGSLNKIIQMADKAAG
ncbi:hypothetical protein DID77_00015 [Candidatus Marinamargulisbacteria bacterium SCGC AG-439-L15]|nr:hypothetical protein DID77_00015 [Candidatus Marinamargulisbacteria bacterium SCGC AG-439-L15]